MSVLETARQFAIAAHGAQRYGDQPYILHLDAVARLAEPYGEEAVILAYLHDVLEDTPVTEAAIRQAFGDFVADCVAILTDEPGADRRERKFLTYAKMADIENRLALALIVKVCDRLANVRACVREGDRMRFERYRQEHPAFHTAVYRAGLCDDLWAELDRLLGV
ncbi:MAG: HD domain-containing protein [Nitrospirae bacterium]|nr:MAG: HD domain-containing protein [Nitrospirota bacterium]